MLCVTTATECISLALYLLEGRCGLIGYLALPQLLEGQISVCFTLVANVVSVCLYVCLSLCASKQVSWYNYLEILQGVTLRHLGTSGTHT